VVYVIVVYDLEADRTRRLRKPLRRKLTHVQNSVFEGELTAGQADDVEATVERVVDPERGETGIVYRLSSETVLDRTAVGDDPATGAQFL
jgi:CRISPR-associated protein Cas2